MMNYIWPLMIFFSFLCATTTGNINNLSSSVLSSGTDAISLSIKLLGIICLWNGLIHIADVSGLTRLLSKLLNPVMRLLFPRLKDKEAKETIALNITANILGLDNAATPLGLKAMKRLNEINGSRGIATDEMVRFVVINTASIHIVPTTVALLRQQHGSSSPTEIMIPALITSALALFIGVSMTFVLKRFFK